MSSAISREVMFSVCRAPARTVLAAEHNLRDELKENYTDSEQMKLRSLIFPIFLISLFLMAPVLWAQDGLEGAVSKVGHGPSLLPNSFEHRFVAADFDNDQKPDGAVLLDAGNLNGQKLFRIELHVTAGENNELTFESNETALTLSALDVNQDGAPDIIVEQAFTHKRLQVWLNDGHGLFHELRGEDFPSAPASSFQWGSPLHWQVDLSLTLPSKLGSDHEVLIQQVLRFDSSSSNWRDRADARFDRLRSIHTRSPRGPPAYLSL